MVRLKMDRRALALCLLLAGSGLLWSSRGFQTVSLWWRARIVSEKLLGRLPFLAWRRVPRVVGRSYYSPTRPYPPIADTLRHLQSQVLNGRQCELVQTSLGNIWAPAPARTLLADLLWEMTVQEDYESGDVHIRPGDIVVDGGAHVGVFTQYALLHGAGRVIAVEPDPTNFACLEANFARQIAEGHVVLIKAGLWEKEARLTLTEPSGADSGSPTFLAEPGEGTRIDDLPVLTLDAIVAQSRLNRVDFIKMDIEGSEHFALRSARGTLRRFKPRMAIYTSHLLDDPVGVPVTASGFVPDYTVHAIDIEFCEGRITPKVFLRAADCLLSKAGTLSRKTKAMGDCSDPHPVHEGMSCLFSSAAAALFVEGALREDFPAFFDGICIVGFEVAEGILLAARPGDLDAVGLRGFAQSKGKSQFALRAVA